LDIKPPDSEHYNSVDGPKLAFLNL
jgi:hypothetical protein